MSETFSGFSEDDIKKLNSTNGTIEVEDKSRRVIKAKRRSDLNNINQQLKSAEVIEPISEDAKLGKKEETADNLKVFQQPVALPVANGTNDNEKKSENKSFTIATCKVEKKVINLEEFQERQKRIEEQNKRRKELLTQVLADRTKQTEEEARRLKEIQNEFKKLDALLSTDVSILRHQIEIASLDFMEAQKRYNKVEKEFLDAKLNLHQRLEKKEMLTEHLFTIIEKNEERKAEKLNELMYRLTVDGKTLVKTESSTSENGTADTKEMVLDNTKNSLENISNTNL